jgi:hypothetical protein
LKLYLEFFSYVHYKYQTLIAQQRLLPFYSSEMKRVNKPDLLAFLRVVVKIKPLVCARAGIDQVTTKVPVMQCRALVLTYAKNIERVQWCTGFPPIQTVADEGTYTVLFEEEEEEEEEKDEEQHSQPTDTTPTHDNSQLVKRTPSQKNSVTVRKCIQCKSGRAHKQCPYCFKHCEQATCFVATHVDHRKKRRASLNSQQTTFDRNTLGITQFYSIELSTSNDLYIHRIKSLKKVHPAAAEMCNIPDYEMFCGYLLVGDDEKASAQSIVQFLSNRNAISIVIAHNASFERDVTKTIINRFALTLPDQTIIFVDSIWIIQAFLQKR